MKTAWQSALDRQLIKIQLKKKQHRLKLFLAGMVQIMFVAINVIMVADHKYIPALVTSFCLSGIWCYNVKHISIGDTYDGLSYATGASIGTMIGMFLTQLIYS